ncbi:MAG TPA: PPC domain-containing DNA-binding protein [Polyangiaceae bacterium]|nr:PPC domain-containing DNA-binding protein [Polyangiaceae bacterium]
MRTERVPEGEDVVEYLANLAGPLVAWVAGVGIITDVALSILDEAGETPRTLPGTAQLLSLSGPPTGPLMALVAGADGALRGGRLLRAVARGVSLSLFDAAAIRNVAGPANRPARPAPAGDDDEADEAPRYGDRVDHFVFGLCDVMVVREERMKIRDVSGGGKLREIHLGAVKVLKPTIEDGRRVFKLARK